MKHTYDVTSNATYGPYEHGGGPLTVQAKGTWAGGTLSVQVNTGAGFTQVESFTADEERNIYPPQGAQVQYVMSGASSPDLDIAATS